MEQLRTLVPGVATMQLDCPHCRRAIVVPESLAGTSARCPICSGVVPVPFLAAPPPAPAKASATIPYDWLALLSYLCPLWLLLTMCCSGLYGFGYGRFYRSLTPYERSIPELRQEQMPPAVVLFGCLACGAGLLGFGLTLTVFTLALIRKHRVAWVVALVTIGASFPLLGCCIFGTG